MDPVDRDVGLPYTPINDWYTPWESVSRWENRFFELWSDSKKFRNSRYTAMSDADIWAFDLDKWASKMEKPIILIHGDHSDGFKEAVMHVYDSVSYI